MCCFSRHDIIIKIKDFSNDSCQIDGQTALSLSLASGLHITECLGGNYGSLNPRNKQLGEPEASLLACWKGGLFSILCVLRMTPVTVAVLFSKVLA